MIYIKTDISVQTFDCTIIDGVIALFHLEFGIKKFVCTSPPTF